MNTVSSFQVVVVKVKLSAESDKENDPEIRACPLSKPVLARTTYRFQPATFTVTNASSSSQRRRSP